MSLTDLHTIADGSKVYLRPVGRVSAAITAGRASFDFGGTGLRYTGACVYARTGKSDTSSGYFSAEQILFGLDGFESTVRQALNQQITNFARPVGPLELKDDLKLSFSRSLVMGVLNVTPDSFSDGGRFLDAGKAIRHARAMISAGADIIDIGGESTRPGATPVWEGEEADRIVPVIHALAQESIPISVDTRNALVMEKALQAGAHMVNDVSALTHDPDSLALVAERGIPVILMHAQGDPRTMQDNPDYDHVLLDVYDYLSDRIDVCEQAGISRHNIIVDPGIGFGKRVVKDNLALINGLLLFRTLGCPVLLGASRKRFIGATTGIETASERLPGSLSAAIYGVRAGANIIRAHDVAETAQALKLAQALQDASVMDGLV